MNFFVINLKKYFFSMLFFIFTISLLIFSENNLLAAQNGIMLWSAKVLPVLFPFFIATEILCSTNFCYILGNLLKSFMKPFFNVPGEAALAIILGTISGSPVGAKTVCNLKNQKIISKIEAERLIAFTNNSGPLFIVSTIGYSLFKNKTLGYILLFSHILSALVVGHLFKFWKKDKLDINYNEIKFNSKQSPIKISELGEVLSNSIKNAITTLLSIGGFIVFFSILISTLNSLGIIQLLKSILELFHIPPKISEAFIIGSLELTNGVELFGNLYSSFPLVSLLFTSFLIGFGGFSVLLQVYSIISKENISIKPYFLGKLLQGIISSIITYLII